MLVSKIGDDLAVRLSADDVARLGLKEGDQVELTLTLPKAEPVYPDPSITPEQWLERMRRFRGMLPDDFKFDRDEANAR